MLSAASLPYPRPNLNFGLEELNIMTDCLMSWRPAAASTPLGASEIALRRFHWVWQWTYSAVSYFGRSNPTASVDALFSKLKSAVRGIPTSSLPDRSAPSGDAPLEDIFFDKTVQTLVHEHLPMGVIMIQLGANGFSDDEPPVINNMVCELFGYSRQELSQLLMDAKGWRRLYHKQLHLDIFKRLVLALLFGTDCYVSNAIYTHKTGWVFEGLESRRISFGRDGLPTYMTVYIQRCDSAISPTSTRELTAGSSGS